MLLANLMILLGHCWESLLFCCMREWEWEGEAGGDKIRRRRRRMRMRMKLRRERDAQIDVREIIAGKSLRKRLVWVCVEWWDIERLATMTTNQYQFDAIQFSSDQVASVQFNSIQVQSNSKSSIEMMRAGCRNKPTERCLFHFKLCYRSENINKLQEEANDEWEQFVLIYYNQSNQEVESKQTDNS